MTYSGCLICTLKDWNCMYSLERQWDLCLWPKLFCVPLFKLFFSLPNLLSGLTINWLNIFSWFSKMIKISISSKLYSCLHLSWWASYLFPCPTSFQPVKITPVSSILSLFYLEISFGAWTNEYTNLAWKYLSFFLGVHLIWNPFKNEVYFVLCLISWSFYNFLDYCLYIN